MKLANAAPAAAPAPAEPITEPADDAGFGGFGGDEETPKPEANDKPFNDEPFDAGVEAEEETDPKKFIEQLTGKLGQSLRKYTEEQGQPDFELEKFAINSLLSATHTAEMDEDDKKDIIKKVNTSGDDGKDNEDDNNNDSGSSDESGDEFGGDMGNDETSDEEDLQELSIFENFFLDNPKKNNMFQEGSNDILDEESDRCTRIAKRKYDVWPSAYASGAVVKCRQGKIWKDLHESDLNMLGDYKNMTDEQIDEAAKKTDFSKEKESGLHGWFSRRGGEGSQGWVDCNTCRDGKCKPCGRKDGEERSKYPSCRPTPSACKTKGRGESWGKKAANESESVSTLSNTSQDNYMFWQNLKGIYDDATEILGMNQQEVDELIANGHQWAVEHVITSKDDVEEVYHFIEATIEGTEINEGEQESNNYMFWSSLKTIKHASREILEMNYSNVDALIADGHGWAVDHISTSADDMEEVYHFLANTLDAYDGDSEGGYEDEYGNVEDVNLNEAEYHGKSVKLGKPSSGDVKKFKVYVKNKKGNVVKVNFGDPNMEIKRDNPKRRKSFRARHKCAQAKDRTTPKYWSCKMWSTTPVSKMVSEDLLSNEKNSIFDKNYLKEKLQETFNQDDSMNEPIVKPEPQVAPSPDKVQPNVAPSRKNKPFLPTPDVQPDPKASK